MINTKTYINLITRALGDILEVASFKKKGITYIRESDDTIQMVNVQKCTSSNDNELLVTVNLGIYSKELGARLPYDLGPKNISACHLQARIGYFKQEAIDYWWKVNSEESAKLAIKEITYLVSFCVLPLLSKTNTTSSIYELILRDTTFPFTTINKAAMLQAFSDYETEKLPKVIGILLSR